jgi:hypothetical protein
MPRPGLETAIADLEGSQPGGQYSFGFGSGSSNKKSERPGMKALRMDNGMFMFKLKV